MSEHERLAAIGLRRHAVSCAVGIAALLGIQLAAAASDPVVEQRIQRITNGLLPPVLVKGEEPPPLKLTDRMREAGVPGVSVAVINDGRIEWARGFGVAKVDGPPVTADTLFQAASISKPVSAMAIMSLVQDGKLDLDADVNRYLESWKLPPSEFTKEANVTLRRLLTHTAGTTVDGFSGYKAGDALPTLPQILDGRPPANSAAVRIDSTPGKTWRYSGGGYVMATLLVNDVTGEPFAKLLRERVLDPLGMKDSTFEQPLSPRLLARAALPFQADGTALPGGPHVYPELAAASLWSTPSDLARFAIGMQQALSGKSQRVLDTASARAMSVSTLNQQAIGFAVGGNPQHRYFSHSGSNAGYRCLLVAYEDGDGAIIMTNGDGGDAVIRPLLATIARIYEWPDYTPPVRTIAAVDARQFDRYAGAYRLGNGMTATFWREGDRRYTRVLGQAPVELFPMSSREYFSKALDARFVFADGDAREEVTLYLGDREQSAQRLQGAEGKAALELTLAMRERVRKQTAAAGSEKALRELITGLAAGKPNYERMAPALADRTRTRLAVPQRQALLQLGPVQSVAFKSVSPVGEDVYDVRFERGAREFRILLDWDGRINSAQFSP